jgi:hypothetical protein
MRWRLVLKEYGPELHYIKGEDNIVADALSRLNLNEPKEDAHEVFVFQHGYTQYSPEQMAECFAGNKDDMPTSYPLTYMQIHTEQQNDEALKDYIDKHLAAYCTEGFKHGTKSYDLYTKDVKIVIPQTLQKKAVKFHHELLMHPGKTRTELTMAQQVTWKGMHKTVIAICKKCKQCQLSKPKLRKLGKLPPKEPEVIPWETVCINLIGHYTIGKGKKETHLHCLTMINPATGWFEISEVEDKTSAKIANLFEMLWINHYPWPQQVVMDCGRNSWAMSSPYSRMNTESTDDPSQPATPKRML